MKKASFFAISNKTLLYIAALLVIVPVAFVSISTMVSSNNEPAKCPPGTISSYHKCVVPKDPSQDPCATGAVSKDMCGPVKGPLGTPPGELPKKYVPPAPPQSDEDSTKV